jgi:peptidoglycan-associated lipoprotein
MTYRVSARFGLLLIAATIAACGGNKPPVAAAPPPTSGPSSFPAAGGTPAARPPSPPPLPNDAPVSSEPLTAWDQQSIDAINGPNSPLKPIYFVYDSDELTEEARRILSANADILKLYGTWVITVEGHCDDRGTAEYNLALGDRRALTAKNYLVSLGVAPDRIRTVSYGKEFPFDPGQTEAAWSRNRRAHFMLTAK